MIAWNDLGAALALLFVLEGLLPFLLPTHWREAMRAAVQMSDRQLRLIGFSSMALGLMLLSILRA